MSQSLANCHLSWDRTHFSKRQQQGCVHCASAGGATASGNRGSEGCAGGAACLLSSARMPSMCSASRASSRVAPTPPKLSRPFAASGTSLSVPQAQPLKALQTLKPYNLNPRRGSLAGCGAPLELRAHAQHVQRVQGVDQGRADAPEAVAPLRGQRDELVRAPGVLLIGPPRVLEGLRGGAVTAVALCVMASVSWALRCAEAR